ncbi:MAG: Xaa-Pro peptidase family protein [Nanoarchaeota archaeon]
MKLAEFRKEMDKKGIDACLLTSKDPNFFYFLQQHVQEAIMLILAQGKPVIFISPLEQLNTRGFAVQNLNKDFPELLKKIVQRKRIRVLGINESFLLTANYQKIRRIVKTRDLSQELNQLRSQKTPQEIKIFKHACTITCNIMNMVLADLQKGKFRSEADIRTSLKIKTLMAGCELSFEPIIAHAISGAIPHYYGNKVLKRGFLIIDYGLKYKGYCTDITRTAYIGKPTPQEVLLYQRVLAVQEKTIDFIKREYAKTGEVSAPAVQKHADMLFGKDKKYFTHGIGHGLGIQVHELPGFAPKLKHILSRGMVFTIEPGHYQKTGIRIEDDLCLGKSVEVLTKGVPKAFLAINYRERSASLSLL